VNLIGCGDNDTFWLFLLRESGGAWEPPDLHFQGHRFGFRRRIDDGQKFRLRLRPDVLNMLLADESGPENGESNWLTHGAISQACQL
jgi:hypothetical protein